MKRRIEITREHWKRTQLLHLGPAECPQCLRQLALVPVEAITMAELTTRQLEAALQREELAVWKASPGGPMVCAGCVRDLLKRTRT